MKNIGYIRVSSDKQDSSNQKLAILSYAQQKKLILDRVIEIEISSTKSKEKRRVVELIELLDSGDKLITTELSRLGRNMYETLNIIQEIHEIGVEIIFINQPELSLHDSNPHIKLLYAIYSYFAEAERKFISLRTKLGLAAARAKGVKLGRRKGSKNRSRKLDQYVDQILQFIEIDLPVSSVQKLINSQRPKDEAIAKNTFRVYINQLKQTKNENTNNSK